MEKRRENIFEGRFKVVSVEEYIGGRWVAMDDSKYILDFAVGKLIIYSEDMYSYNARLIEYDGDNERYTEYYYTVSSEGESMSIDRSLYYEDGVMEACFDDQYSIGVQSDGSIYLSLLNDPDEPPPYFRVLIKRV